MIPNSKNSPAVKIADVTYYLPERVVTNDELALQYPSWDMERVQNRAGIFSRHIAGSDETALDLAVNATQELFARNPGLQATVDGIIFCTQSGDYVMPPNACVLHRELDLGEEVFAFDTNLGCSGYVYGLAMAQGLVAAGSCKNILLVTSDTYSKFTHPGDRATRTLFGDGAAVSWICAADGSVGVIDTLCETSGKGFEKFYIPAGGCRNPKGPETAAVTTDTSGNTRTDESIHMDGMGVLSFVSSRVPAQVKRIAERNQLNLADIDLVIFHQASKLALDALTRALGLREEQVFTNLATVGNTVSASIPIALAQGRTDGRIESGATVLLSGFGVGLSWATALVRL